MTLTFECDLDMLKLNQQTTYLGQRSCSSKVLSAHTHKHKHTQPSALSGPRKWSIVIAAENGEMENVNYQMIEKRKHRIAVSVVFVLLTHFHASHFNTRYISLSRSSLANYSAPWRDGVKHRRNFRGYRPRCSRNPIFFVAGTPYSTVSDH